MTGLYIAVGLLFRDVKWSSTVCSDKYTMLAEIVQNMYKRI